ncbi:MAG: ABC transporter ATP-binding protein, partial [Clostridia bacterium]|nr:ABC transporter ATP-binding protein [Clostridia bacterium]
MSKPQMQKPKMKMGVLLRVFKMLLSFYPVLLPITAVCIILSAIVSAVPSIFTKTVLDVITEFVGGGMTDYTGAAEKIFPAITLLACMYVASLILITTYQQLMAYITQGFLSKMRCKMFEGMQNLPIKYFDTHKHGDIMSYYTNDIDTLRQLVSQSLPSLLNSCIIVITVLSIMLYYSVWMTLVVLAGVCVMVFVSKKVGGGSAKFFMRQQKAIGAAEGYIQEMMNGQKVVKVFCHEDKSLEGFDKINNHLYEDSYKAHAYANMLGPIIMNIGNILYVICA